MEAVWSWAEEREREEFPTYSDWSKQGWEAVSAEVAPGSWILAVEHWEVYVRLHTGRNSWTMVNLQSTPIDCLLICNPSTQKAENVCERVPLYFSRLILFICVPPRGC